MLRIFGPIISSNECILYLCVFFIFRSNKLSHIENISHELLYENYQYLCNKNHLK